LALTGRAACARLGSPARSPAETADCPRFLAFLNEATGGAQALIRFLQQFCGYCLTGSAQEHALIFVYGPGKNGKSVLLNTVASAMGDYATTATMDALTVASGERHTTDIAMLRGARVVTASETEEGRAWTEARIKQLTGGDPITALFMRQDNFTFLPTVKLMIVGNHQPTLHNVDEAARRRFNIVPFTRMPANPNTRLEAKLRPEAAGILRWMIDGCLDWQANRLQRSQTIVEATSEYFANQDTFGQWLDEECDVEPGNRWKNETSAALFKSWQAYAARAGDRPVSRKAFADAMEKRGLERDKGASARGFTVAFASIARPTTSRSTEAKHLLRLSRWSGGAINDGSTTILVQPTGWRGWRQVARFPHRSHARA
jgi:putative DNA primase/helicase